MDRWKQPANWVKTRCLWCFSSELTWANPKCETRRSWALRLVTRPNAAKQQTWRWREKRSVQPAVQKHVTYYKAAYYCGGGLRGVLSPPDRLEASWEDSSIICESKWWTHLCVKLPVWVKTGLRLLLIDCGFSLVHDGCQTVLKNTTFPPSTSTIRFVTEVLLLDGGM